MKNINFEVNIKMDRYDSCPRQAETLISVFPIYFIARATCERRMHALVHQFPFEPRVSGTRAGRVTRRYYVTSLFMEFGRNGQIGYCLVIYSHRSDLYLIEYNHTLLSLHTRT